MTDHLSTTAAISAVAILLWKMLIRIEDRWRDRRDQRQVAKLRHPSSQLTNLDTTQAWTNIGEAIEYATTLVSIGVNPDDPDHVDVRLFRFPQMATQLEQRQVADGAQSDALRLLADRLDVSS